MTAITINIPNRKVGFFKKLIAEMGWTYEVREEAQTKAKARLYDPETGEYLNDETMKAIEDVRSGKDKGTLTLRSRTSRKRCWHYEAALRHQDL